MLIKTKSLEIVVNCELCKVYSWLTGNTFILNIKKSNYVIFRPYQKIIVIYDNELNKLVNLECKEYVKYLGLLIDYSLSWNYHISRTHCGENK